MKPLYNLRFFHSPNGDDREGFQIGVFRTREEAEAVKMRYRREVPGFKDYDCESEIAEVPVVGEGEADEVYRWQGWNVNEWLDETDILDSVFFIRREDAQASLEQARRRYARMEWGLNRYRIGEEAVGWKEGFVCDDGSGDE